MCREIKKRKITENPVSDDLNSTINNMYSQQRAYFESFQNKSTNQNEVKLPRINIPPFNGEYTEWPSFKDLYEATVHNNASTPRVHKFQLLKGLLHGSAAQLIKHLFITDASYVEAWDKLKRRYDKKRTIVNTIINTFFGQSSIQHASSSSLRMITETSDELLRGLKALGPDCQTRDPWILYILLNKMDDETKQQWALHSVDIDVPSVDNFIDFLHRRCDALESCNLKVKPPKILARHAYVATTKIECMYCKKPHPLHKCYKFQGSNVEFRKDFANKNMLCVNCLKAGHSVTSCPSLNTCYKCKSKHHTLLHEESNKCDTTKANANTVCVASNSKSSNTGQYGSSELKSYTTTRDTVGGSKQTLLPTVIMSTTDAQGKTHHIRALLDTGSESTFITENATKKLGLKRKHACLTVNGLASVAAGRTRGLINIKLSSRFDSKLFVMVDALILNNLTTCLPSQAILLDENDVTRCDAFPLADPKFYEPNTIEMILGIDTFYDVVKERRILLKPNLHLLDTLFGWVVAGHADVISNSRARCHTIQISSEDVCQLLRRFWEVQETSFETPAKDDECDEHFLSTHEFKNGRHIVQLPFKNNLEQLGSSLKESKARMIAMERKFQRDTHLKAEYTKFMREYEELGHMSRIPDLEVFAEKDKLYYLPHHAVFKQTSVTKKLRVVFDGSCKSSTGLSLNDVLKPGPTIQDDLFTILTRFRKHKIAIVSDIEKMYRQIMVHPRHQNFQRIVWRENPDDKMQHFKLKTVTYGLTCSAYLAIRSLHQTVAEYSEISPKVLEVIKSDFYVDDLLTGCDCIEDAVTFYHDITTTLSQAGFSLRQWSSNSHELLSNIPSEKLGKNSVIIEDPEVYVKTLGICWLTKEDAFTFHVPEISTINQLTKRKLLSECGKIFDPLGWLSPATIIFKILLQSLWLTKIEWDDLLPDDINRTWCAVRNDLTRLTDIRIPRYLHTQSLHTVQYHGFCDASEKAYSAVVYVRSTNINGESGVHLIAAKTKVSPLKQLSIPRLELCGAVLLTKLLHKIAGIFNASADTLYAWTDSNIVLSWLSDVPRKWNCFVANRTSFIIDKLPSNHWQHVPTKLNPADCASRGLTPEELLKHQIWWNGPEYLQKSASYWPNHRDTSVEHTIVERKKAVLIATHNNTTNKTTMPIEYVVDRFSSYMAIIRVLSNCLRFSEICRKKRYLILRVNI